jgi:hypothetical protein
MLNRVAAKCRKREIVSDPPAGGFYVVERKPFLECRDRHAACPEVCLLKIQL